MANVGVAVPFGPALGPIPCADVLNMLYSNGNYYCTPSAAEVSPAGPDLIVDAFTWYDNNTGDEIVFGAGVDGIDSYQEGAWLQLPFLNTTTVTPSGGGGGSGSGGGGTSNVTGSIWAVATSLNGIITLVPFHTVSKWTGNSVKTSVTLKVTAAISPASGSALAEPFASFGPLSVAVVNGTATSYNWTISPGPPVAELDEPTGPTPTLTVAPQGGAVTVTVNCTVTVDGAAVVATPASFTAQLVDEGSGGG